MVKLSIIIPYYQTYDLTKELLETLAPQITKEVEVLLIDDGCHEERLDKYKGQIKITHLKTNGGGGNACNTGLRQAKGKYIAFIDSDDKVANDYVETLLNGIKSNADIIYMDWKDIASGEIIRRPDNYAYWKAIYKKEIVPEFEPQYKFHWDVPFYDTIKERAKTKHYVDKVIYYYNSARPGNLSSIETKIKEEQRKKEILEKIKGGKMIKVEAIAQFTLGEYDKIKDTIERKGIDKPGEVFVGDKFYCEKDMADYLLGANRLNKAVVKVIEVEPEEKPEEEKPKRRTRKKRSC